MFGGTKNKKYKKNRREIGREGVSGQTAHRDIKDTIDLEDEKKSSPLISVIISLIVLLIVIGGNWFANRYLNNKKLNSDANKSNEIIDVSHLTIGSPKLNRADNKSGNVPPIADTSVNMAQIENSRLMQVEHEKNEQHEKMEEKQKEELALLRSPMMINGGQTHISEKITDEAANRAINEDANLVYLQQATQQQHEMTQAGQLGDLNYIIGQGKKIDGVLETPVNSDLPGFIRGHVTQDVYGDQGVRVLIPNGSRLFGTYRSILQNGQSRLFVVWTRLEEPNGIIVRLDTPGSDALGQAGMSGSVDYHYLQRFSSSVLFSILSAGAATYGVSPSDQFNSLAAYREAASSAMSNASAEELNQNKNIQPTVRLDQGFPFSIFVNKDVSFKQIMSKMQLIH